MIKRIAEDDKILGLMQGHLTVIKAPTDIGKNKIMKQLITSSYAPHVNTVVQIGESVDVDITLISFDIQSGKMSGICEEGLLLSDTECHLAMLEFNEQQGYDEEYEL